MSKNFLNFLTTSVIILSCGTVINSSSCYCMESKILSPQNQELSQKLLTELSKMDADIKDELKRNQIIVDKNGQPIENESFFIQDFLRSYQITCNNALNKLLKIICVPSPLIQQFNKCMTCCMHVGDEIGNSLQQLSGTDNKIVLQDIRKLLRDTDSYFFKLSEFQNYADNKDDSNFIEGSSLLLANIISLLLKFHDNLSNNKYYSSSLTNKSIPPLSIVISGLQQLFNNPSHHINDELRDKLKLDNDQLKTKIISKFSETNKQPLLRNTSPSNNNQRKNTHDSLKKDLISQLSNIIPSLQQLCSALSMQDQENFLAAISASQNIAKLTDIMEGTEEKININTDNLTWQQLLNYLGNKIYLVSINYMQNIKESITDNNIDVKEIAQKIMDPSIVCCETVRRITSNLKEYLASISTDNSYTDTQKYLAKNINQNASLTSSIKNLADAIKELQQIQKDFNNKNINNSGQIKDNNIKQAEDSNIIKENNLNNTVLKSSKELNNSGQIENIKQQVEVNNITEENNNSLQNNPGFNSSSENSNNIQPVENSKTISNLADALNKNVLLACINVLYDNKLQNTKYSPYLNELRTILLDYAGNIGNLVDTILPKKPIDSDWQFVQPLKKLAYNREYLTNKAQLGLFSLDINNTEYVTFEQLVNFVSNKIADSVNHVINDILSSERRELLSDIRITPDMTLLSSIESIVQIIRKMRSFLQNDDGLQNLAAKSITLKTALTKCNNLLEEPILRLCRLFQDTQSSKTSSKKEQLITSAATNRFIV